MIKETTLSQHLISLGIALAFLLVLIGGILFLGTHGNLPLNYVSFKILHKFPISLRCIEIGLLLLVVMQIVRVILTTWVFFKEKDVYFTIIGCFIVIVLLATFT